MKIFALIAVLITLPLAARADNPPATPPPANPGPVVDPTDPPQAPPQGPTAPACSNNGKDISTDDVAILNAIKGAQFCWQAVQLAENCGTGDGTDFNLVNAAAPVCEKEFDAHRPTNDEKTLLQTMRNACDAKWKNKNGGQYVSANAYCKLKAWQWMANLTAENP
jgi:hypothetical protein